jgi:glycosyltransferase involved in cell wall biosynthesis
MKILYISQYFHPEIGATTNRALANVRYFANKKHDVTVLTELPNHPKGIFFEGYKHKIFMKEKMENFIINRVWVFTSRKKNFMTRILFYISFMLMGILHTLFNWKRYDLVYVTSPPLFVGMISIVLKKTFPKTKFIFEVRDLWPDSAIELGELNNKLFLKLSLKLEKKIYDTSDYIIAISKDMRNKIIKKGYNKKKISIIYNGTDETFIKNNFNKFDKDIYNNDDNNKLIGIYAGIIGIAQGLEVLLTAANELKNENIEFYLIGNGPKLKKLKKMAKNMQLNNLFFIEQVSRNKIPDYLHNADFGIIPLKKMDLFKGALPSKIFDYMSCDLPIVLGIEGEAKKLINESGTGICFEPDNVNDLIEKILWLKNNRGALDIMKSKGRKFVSENFDRSKLAEKLEKIIMEVVNNK